VILLIDNYDSFTYILFQYLSEWDKVKVIRNDENLPDLKQIKSVVISPGPGKPQTSGKLMEFLEIILGKKPILGVCLGHQAIGEFHGANLIKTSEIYHGRVSKVSHNSNALFQNIPATFLANRYHSWTISSENFPNELEVTASTESGVIMGIMSKKYKDTFGVQFHPESILTEYGQKMIKNFCEIS